MKTRKMSAEQYGKEVINRINVLLEQKGMTQRELATNSGIGASSLSKILSGDMRLTVQHVFKICNALEMKPEDLLAFGKDIAFEPKAEGYSIYEETGIINEQYLNEQIFIRDKNHPAFNGYIGNSFYVYLFSTITSEAFLLEGTLTFETEDVSFCKVTMVLNTGKTGADGAPVKKVYTGEWIVSLTMGACYCILTNTDIGEICFLNFKHMYLFNNDLECRVGTISSSSSGGNRLPVVQRILISKVPLRVSGMDRMDLEFVQGQLRLNNSRILISKKDLEVLKERYEKNGELTDFFEQFEDLTQPEEYYLLDEANMKNISLPSNVKTEGLGILRNMSSALRYNKVSSKTDEFIFEYICNMAEQKK